MYDKKTFRLTKEEIAEIIPLVIDQAELSDEQAHFLAHYIACSYNAGEAYKRAGLLGQKDPAYAKTYAAAFMAKEPLREVLREVKRYLLEDIKNNLANQVAATRAAQATFDITEIINPETGELTKPIHEIPECQRALIKKITVDFKGKDADRKVINIEFMEKEHALRQLERFCGLDTPPKQEVVHTLDEATAQALSALRDKAMNFGVTPK